MSLFLGLFLATQAPAQVTIDFDGLAPGCTWGTHVYPATTYSALGVSFSGGGGVLDECGNFGVSGHSSPNFLAFNPGAGYPGPETLTFNPPASMVTMNAGSGAGGAFTADAYDASGALVDSVAFTLTGPVQQAVLVAPDITTVVIDAAGSYWVVDDLYFESTYGGVDNDGDGWGDLQDCDDNDPAIYPGAPEQCDGLDNDCDGVVLDPELDLDADGAAQCDGDCDDDEPAIHPGAAELCDGLDNDCSGQPDPDELDADGDGFRICDGDCDDGAASVYPGADDPDGDGIDQDCDGSDGVAGTGTGGTGTGGTGTGTGGAGTGTGGAGTGTGDIDTDAPVVDKSLAGCACSQGPIPAGGWWLALPALLGIGTTRRRRAPR